MAFFRLIFPVPATPPVGEAERARTPRWVDLLLFMVLLAVGYGIVRATSGWREPIPAKLEVDLSPWQLPRYAGLSTFRMAFAYLLSLVFSLVYARLAVASRAAERIMLPLLDILQSIPILSFMPGVVLALAALLPGRTLGLELAAIVLIFTSQAWNMAFSFHQSLITIPTQLSEAARIYRLGFWQRFSRLELPFGAIGLIANSMMSWAGGWFFLMASEQFTLGAKDLRLPGLGSYLAHAAELGDTRALLLGLATLISVILLLDQIIWRPLVAWSDKFKVEQSTSGDAFTSPVLELLRGSELVAQARRAVGPALRRLDAWLTLVTDRAARRPSNPKRAVRRRLFWLLVGAAALAGTVWGLVAAIQALAGLNSADWDILVRSAAATFTRTAIALVIAVAWTVPVGVAIGMNPRWAQRAAPIVQTIASIPATAVFPVLLLVLIQLPGGLNAAAVALMLLGTQWYVLFNVIAGASAIPSDLREAARTFRLSGWQRWRTLILPAIFPYLVTGMITATGGAWNASIVSEYVSFGGRKVATVGLGAVIAEAADNGNGRLLLAGTVVMALVVIATNRLLWRRLYRLAESRFRLE
jgi:NitT/TauT family transport system permease protein